MDIVTGGAELIAVLGGPLSPLGWCVGIIEAPRGAVLERLLAWRRELGADLEVTEVAAPWPGCLHVLDPLEAAWTTELLVGHGDARTMYLNNHLGGGDPWPASSYVAGLLGVPWLVAMHQPLTPIGHASTQLWLGGPEGEPPLGYIRTMAAHAEDHRWSWATEGPTQPFEDVSAYRARRIRDRFPRALLISYLRALGVEADNPTRYGSAVRVRQRVSWRSRRETIVQARKQWELPSP